MEKWKIICGILIVTSLVIIGCKKEVEEETYEFVEEITNEPKEEWILDKYEVEDITIDLKPYYIIHYNYLEPNDIAFKIPEKFKLNISNVVILEVKEPYDCIHSCPTTTSLNGCEYGICHRDFNQRCIDIDEGHKEIESRCDRDLRVKLRYQLTRWEKQ